MPSPEKTLLLDKRQIARRINRIAFEIYEDCYDEKEIFIVGIRKNGYVLAERIRKSLSAICGIRSTLVSLDLDKKNPIAKPIEISADAADMKNKSVILVDDVLNRLTLQHLLCTEQEMFARAGSRAVPLPLHRASAANR